MNRFWLSAVLICVITMASFAQGFYFDAGLGLGFATTEIGGDDMSEAFAGSGIKEIGYGAGLKMGYGPIAGLPFYLAAAAYGVGHRFSDDYNYIAFNSFLLGPSLIVYPLKNLQIAGSVGYSLTKNDSDISGMVFLDSKSGYAGDASIAFDFSSKNNGLLLGARYFISSNTLEISEAEQKMTAFTVFLRYVYKHVK